MLTARIFTIVLFSISTIQIQATSYYVAQHGNDQNDGKTLDSPWRTVQKINDQVLQPGDTVFFHSGHVFSGTLQMNNSGTKDAPIVIGSFAGGDKPVLKGTITLGGF